MAEGSATRALHYFMMDWDMEFLKSPKRMRTGIKIEPKEENSSKEDNDDGGKNSREGYLSPGEGGKPDFDPSPEEERAYYQGADLSEVSKDEEAETICSDETVPDEDDWPTFEAHQMHVEATKAQMKDLAETCGTHPWAVRPDARSRSHNLTKEELARLALEQTIAREAGLKWQDRGPQHGVPNWSPGDPPVVKNWRGNPWREGKYGGKVRYARRGGKRREYYAELNRLGFLKPTRHGAVRVNETQATTDETVRAWPAKKEEPPGAWPAKLSGVTDEENWATHGV